MKKCRYCQQEAALLRISQDGYPYSRDYGPMWVCVPCAAWVGCHRGTEKPLGGLATAELRALKIKAHAAFDPLWEGKMRRDKCDKRTARTAGYRWLAGKLGIDVKLCHIGYMNEAECKRVIEICEAVRSKANQ